jgi:hypothetical protein
MKLIIYLGIIFLTLGCSASDSSFKLPDNAKELIAGTESKDWKLSKRFNKGYRMNMEGCFLSYVVTYKADGTFSDNNGKHRGCGESLNGTWELVTNKKGHFLKVESPQIPEIMGIEEEYKMMKILNLQDLEMQLQFVHKEYTESAKMIDYLVPIEVEVPDRRFKY